MLGSNGEQKSCSRIARILNVDNSTLWPLLLLLLLTPASSSSTQLIGRRTCHRMQHAGVVTQQQKCWKQRRGWAESCPEQVLHQ
jgi:hypothetical protein